MLAKQRCWQEIGNCSQQMNLTNDYGIAEDNNTHAGMGEACREEYKVKDYSYEKVRIRVAI